MRRLRASLACVGGPEAISLEDILYLTLSIRLRVCARACVVTGEKSED